MPDFYNNIKTMKREIWFWEMIYNHIASKQARKLQATLVRNYDSPTDWLTEGGEV